MRTPWIALTAALLCTAAVPFEITRDIVATATAALFEAVPFLLVGRIVARFVPRQTALIVSLFGCGCGDGPAARSLPALWATWLAFGPLPAILRWTAAMLTGQLVARRHAHPAHTHSSLINDLAAIVPYAMLTGMISHVVPFVVSLSHVTPVLALLGGAGCAFLLAPCGLGVVGIASALHAYEPMTAIGFLAVAGIFDVRTIVHMPAFRLRESAAAYWLLGSACAFVAWQHGAALVHPRFTIPLWMCATACIYIGCKTTTRFTAVSIVPTAMLAIAITGAPLPAYTATATTLDAAFPGERLTFTGILVRNLRATVLTRYAITCCRADAIPVSVKLRRDIPVSNGRWVQAHGTLVWCERELCLNVARYAEQPPPDDVFLYR